MSYSDFESYSEGEWEEPWDIAWNEFDWENYLRRQDKTIQTYLSYYEKALDKDDRIDEVAQKMGWAHENWASDETLSSESEPLSDALAKSQKEDDADCELDPYTIQKHPIYISTKAIYSWIGKAWEQVAPACASKIPAKTALGFQASLFHAEQNSFMAIQALDMADYSLVVCLLKRSLGQLNQSFAMLQQMDDTKTPPLVYFKAQAHIRLFDIREIWLRVMRDCREELARRFGDRES
jgi:hypothetical protein